MKARSILIVAPEASPGQPVAERVRSFIEFFQQEGIVCQTYRSPDSLVGVLSLVKFIYTKRQQNVFITMPPFRNWLICFLPRVNVILDIRDGWSIAMRTGYGGTAKPRRFKSWIARFVEQIAIKWSALTITCTPGLVRYHSTRWNRSNVLFVPNGFPSHQFPLVKRLRSGARNNKKERNKLTFICAGKFSEYGIDKAKGIIRIISRDYSDYSCEINIFSKDIRKDQWVYNFIRDYNLCNIKFNLYNSVSYDEIIDRIVKSDYGIVLIRDEDYDFGTKVFDYLVCGTKILKSFDESKDFYKYFRAFFERGAPLEAAVGFLRGEILHENRIEILKNIK